MPVDIRKPLKKFMPHLLHAQSSNLNEADTVQRLIKFFEEVLGYDGLSDISREAQMKGKFVDVVLKVDGVVRLLVEAKAADEKLRERHMEQAQRYASENNYRWALLTNGVQWNLYHLTFEEGIEYETAFVVDLAQPGQFEKAAECLALLHKTSIKKDELEEFWNKATAMGPASIGRALMQEDVLAAIRREVRKEEGLLTDVEDLLKAIHEMLSPEAREQIGPMKVKRKRAAPAKRSGPTSESATTATEVLVNEIAVGVPAQSTAVTQSTPAASEASTAPTPKETTH